MNVETVKAQFKSLRLPTAAGEIDGRKQNALKQRIKQAGFPELTTLENFDWSFNSDIDQEKL